MIDWEQIQDRILSLVSIEDIINKYTCNKIVRNRTNCINSECSGVQERTMSLQNGFAYCFRCGKNYNQIQAVMELQKCEFVTSCKMIITDFGLPIEIDKPLTANAKLEYAKRKEKEKQDKLRESKAQKELIYINLYFAVWKQILWDNDLVNTTLYHNYCKYEYESRKFKSVKDTERLYQLCDNKKMYNNIKSGWIAYCNKLANKKLKEIYNYGKVGSN